MNEPFPRVTLPGADEAKIAEIRELLETADLQALHLSKERHGMAEAMVALGRRPAKPGVSPKEKASRRAANRRARAARRRAA